ncbi:PQQ-binding-like beta-propeller repeat protein, partial [Halorussus sp. GCM10023401]
MQWSPTRREFLAGAAVGGVGVGDFSWTNATDAVPDHLLAPRGSVEWSVGTGDGPAAVSRFSARDRLYVRTPGGVRALGPDGAERWRFEVDSGDPESLVETYAAETDGATETLYVETRRGLAAIDAADGSVRWRYGDDDGRRHVDVSLATAETVFLSENGLTALDAEDGTERWRFEPDGPVWLSSQFHEGTLYVGTIRGGFYALDAAGGEVRWRTALEASGDDGPYVLAAGTSDGVAFAWNSSESVLAAFDADDGSPRWTVATNAAPTGFPGTVRKSTVYIADGSVLRARSAASGTVRWRYDAGEAVANWPRFADETMYVGAAGGVHAVSTTDGTRCWTFDTRTDAAAVVAGVDDGTVFVDSRTDALYGLDARSGRLRWRFPYSGESTWPPEVRNGIAYFGTESGTVYAVSGPDGPTPLYDAARVATGPFGVAAGGLLAGGALAAAYRRRKRANAPPPEPTAFADFERETLVAESPKKELFRARTPAGGRVALARLAPDVLAPEAFAAAVEAWAGLDCEGVLEVRQWGTEPRPWVAAEWAAGGSLADRAGKLPLTEIGRVVADVAEIVHLVRREEVTHGRLVPGNVLFTGGAARVADWRLAA